MRNLGEMKQQVRDRERPRSLDDGRKSEICEHIRNLRFLRTAADASTERAVSSRAERARASESQPAQRSEQEGVQHSFRGSRNPVSE